ncbi:hypothetical protein [Gorillibacterium timonense]|uniref:hypothetical protein n=1 Tax=Gorillibacterium timonense TaxID=1689269 RepID=UPI00131AAD98|nr:hypothetical protein [Gorillibacterium timonense]
MTQDKPLLSEEELTVLLGEERDAWKELEERQLLQAAGHLPGVVDDRTAYEEIKELKETVRQLHIRIEFLENLFREHVQACGTAERERGEMRRFGMSKRSAYEHEATGPAELAPETFPPRKDRRKRRRSAK